MVTVCAWCQRFMGFKGPLSQADVSHGICSTCSARQRIDDFPVLVVSRARAETLPVLEGLLMGTPEIRVVVDRRKDDRRQKRPVMDVPERRRRLRDRRERMSLVLT
jgi:hypothetical protein